MARANCLVAVSERCKPRFEPNARIACLRVMRIFISLFFFAAVCATAQKPSVRQWRPAFHLPVAKDAPPELRNDDSLRMKLEGVPEKFTGEFNSELMVDDGTITVPLIGRIRAVGLTPAQVAAAIERELIAKKFFTAPRISLERTGWIPMVTIRGDVRAPGRAPWTPELTLSAVLSASGGPSGYRQDLTITRAGKVTSYSQKSIKADPKLDPKLEPGDLIEVVGEY